MKKEYILPDFKNLNTYWIDNSIQKIKKSRLYRPDFEAKPSIEKYIKAVQLLKNNQKLYKRDYKVLIFYLDRVEKENLFHKFLQSFVNNINSFSGVRTFIRPFHNYIYNFYDKSSNVPRMYTLLRALQRGFPDKEKYKKISDKISASENIDIFLKNIKTEFKHFKAETEIDDYCRLVFLKNTDRFYYECMKEFIVANYLNDDLGSLFTNVMGKMELEIKKHIFREILLNYKDNYNTDSYPEGWFKLIHKELKDPYDPSNQRWHGIEEEVREIFRRWNVDKRISDFFGTVVGGDQRRLEFWKQYANNVYRIEYFKDVNDALVMQFKDHTFVEFAEHNNALYIYNKIHIDVEIVKSKISSSILSKNEKLKMLKDRNVVLKWMAHRGEWEYDFNHTMLSLGYRKSRW